MKTHEQLDQWSKRYAAFATKSRVERRKNAENRRNHLSTKIERRKEYWNQRFFEKPTTFWTARNKTDPWHNREEKTGPCLLDWNEARGVGARRSPLWAPRSWTRVPPVSLPSRASARAAAPAGQGSTNVRPTVDSYGPPPPSPHSSQAYMGRKNMNGRPVSLSKKETYDLFRLWTWLQVCT